MKIYLYTEIEFIGYSRWEVCPFDPEKNGADLDAFVKMWPDTIYFYANEDEI